MQISYNHDISTMMKFPSTIKYFGTSSVRESAGVEDSLICVESAGLLLPVLFPEAKKAHYGMNIPKEKIKCRKQHGK